MAKLPNPLELWQTLSGKSAPQADKPQSLGKASQDDRRFRAYAVTKKGGTSEPIDADEILIDLGLDSAGRPLQVKIQLRDEGWGHKMLSLMAPLKDSKNPDNYIAMTSSGDESNWLRVTVKYAEDGRSNEDAFRGVRQERMGPDPRRPDPSEQEVATLRHMVAHRWDGSTLELSLTHGWSEERKEWSRVVQRGDWARVPHLLRYGADPNDWQLSGASRNTPLHWAAEGGAPAEVVQTMVAAGGWRNIVNAAGERPFDIAVRKNHRHLLEALTPVVLHDISVADLAAMQTHFHGVIRRPGTSDLHQLRSPELGILLELEEPKMSFSVPGQYGGYQYWLEKPDGQTKLIVESRSRVVSGGVPRWEITPAGATRVESVNTQ